MASKAVFIMGIDQYGDTWHDLGPHPRKTLLERLGRSSAAKMYRDTKSGTKHVGYIIAGRWIRLYRLTEWNGGAMTEVEQVA